MSLFRKLAGPYQRMLGAFALIAGGAKQLQVVGSVGPAKRDRHNVVNMVGGAKQSFATWIGALPVLASFQGPYVGKSVRSLRTPFPITSAALMDAQKGAVGSSPRLLSLSKPVFIGMAMCSAASSNQVGIVDHVFRGLIKNVNTVAQIALRFAKAIGCWVAISPTRHIIAMAGSAGFVAHTAWAEMTTQARLGEVVRQAKAFCLGASDRLGSIAGLVQIESPLEQGA